MTHSRTRSPRWATVVDDFRARRAARSARATLARDMAVYTSPSDRSDMNAILDRYDSAEVAELRTLLNRVSTAA